MEENFFSVQFPEAFYLSHSPNTEKYSTYINIGYSQLYSRHFLFCGLARNCEKQLKLNHERILYLRHITNIHSYSYKFIENDSTDNTASYIKDNVIGESFTLEVPLLQGKSLLRRTVMADMRNKYVPKESIYDYVVVYDMDIEGGFSYEGFLHSIGYLEEHSSVGAVTANGIQYRINSDNRIERLFYDTWAYRPLKNKEEDESKYNLLRFNRGETPFAVESNFGGMGIYRGSIFTKNHIQYTNEDCDHVTIHKQIREMGFKVVLNPSLIVLYSPNYYTHNPS